MTRRIENIDGIDHQQCTKCDLWFPMDCFTPSKKYRSGRMSTCRNCSPSKKMKKKTGFVYFIGYADFVKIGFWSGDVDTLFASTQTKNPEKLTIYGIVPSDDIQTLEAQLHDFFADVWHRGEWFTNADYILNYVACLDDYRELNYSRDIYSRLSNLQGKVVELTSKVCNVCNKEKSYSEFTKLRTSPDGYSYKCKQCRSDKYKSKGY